MSNNRTPFRVAVLRRLPDTTAPEDGFPEQHWELVLHPVSTLDEIVALRQMCGGSAVGSFRELSTCTIKDQIFGNLARLSEKVA